MTSEQMDMEIIRAMLSRGEVLCQLAEEVADVLLCLELAGATAGPGVPAKIDGTMFEKAARWAGRLAAREKETEGR